MNIISIDPSKSATGICIKHENKIISDVIGTKGLSEEKAYVIIAKRIEEIIKKYNIQVALIEGYAWSKNVNRSFSIMAEVKGIILNELYKKNVKVITVPIKTWQMLCKGILPKKKEGHKKYLDYVKVNYKKEFNTVDQADAYLILNCMYLIWNGLIKTNEHIRLQKQMQAIGEVF